MSKNVAKRLYTNLKKDEGKFYTEDLADMLDTIFGNLRKAEKFIDVRFDDALSQSPSVPRFECRQWGLTRILDLLPAKDNTNILTATQDNRYHNAVCMALARTQYAVRGFEIGRNRNALSPYPDLPTLSWFSSNVTQIPVSNLQIMKVCIDVYRLEDERKESVQGQTRRQHVQRFAAFLAKAANLDVLVSRFGGGVAPLDGMRSEISDHCRDVFHAIATRTNLDGSLLELPCDGKLLPNLKTLDLEYHMIPFELLIDFCAQRKRTLRNVRLRLVTDGDEEQPQASDRIRKAVNASLEDGFNVSLSECYFDDAKALE